MLEARIGPEALHLALRRRTWWRGGVLAWQDAWPGVDRPADAPAALRSALAQARAALGAAGVAWPKALAVEIDDAWVRHAAVQGEFFAMSRSDIDAASLEFFARALGQDPGELALCLQPQPDGRSMWAACLPAALRDGLAVAAREHGLALRALRPALQRLVGPARRWPANGVLAIGHGAGVLIACRRRGSWIALANEMRRFDAAVAARAEALCRFHGIALDARSRWAVLPADRPLPDGWQRVAEPARDAGAAA